MKWYSYEKSEGDKSLDEVKPLMAEPFLTPVQLPIWLVMNKDKTEIHFAAMLFGRWYKAFEKNGNPKQLTDVEYFSPVLDDAMLPSPDWKVETLNDMEEIKQLANAARYHESLYT